MRADEIYRDTCLRPRYAEQPVRETHIERLLGWTEIGVNVSPKSRNRK